MIGFKFWSIFLVVLGALITLYSAVFLTFSGLLNIDYGYINTAFWRSQTVPAIAADFQSWIYGVCGALSTAFGLFIVFIARIPFKRKEPWSWYCLASCVSVWFVLDTLISLSFKVYTNAVGNLVVFILLMLPLAFTRRYFFSQVAQNALPA